VPSVHIRPGTAADGLAGYAQLHRGAPPACVTVRDPIELWRFYVDRAAHGTGVAQSLMAAVRDAAVAAGARHLWLGVREHNPRAIRFYAKCGFVDVGSHDFVLGTNRQTDRVMTAPVPTR
jgi:diamine N-acetyltransferase